MPVIRLVVRLADAGERLDVFVARMLPDVSRSHVKRLIAGEQLTVNGRLARPAHAFAPGETIVVRLPEPTETPLTPEPLTVPLLHVDDAIIVVDKPPGLVVHPGAGRSHHTLVQQLLSAFPEIAQVGHPTRPGIVHRLDKDTSGVLVVARTAPAYQWLVRQFAERAVEKIYLALVHGTPDVEHGIIDAPVGRHQTRRTAMAVVRSGRPAVTHFQVREQWGRFTLLEIRPDTGRTHQIRVHLAAAGLPIAGDSAYGGSADLTELRRLFLHAWSLGFVHPASRQRVTYVAPLPGDLAGVLATLAPCPGKHTGFDHSHRAFVP